MIVDTFENSDRYLPLNANFKKAFEYIKKTDFNALELGKYEIDGDIVYASVSEYETKIASRPEYHKNYIDIQFLASGEEYIGYAPLSNVQLDGDYDSNIDLGWAKGNVDFIKIGKNRFAIFFPQDAHQPCMATGTSQKVKKVVVKVRIA